MDASIGRARYVHDLARPLANDDAADDELLAVLTELARVREEAAEATKATSAVVAMLSHEIRTPLQAIIGFTHLLAGTPLDAQQREFVDKASRAADVLLRTVNDVLDLSKIEAGAIELESAPFDLASTLADIDAVIGTLARTKGLEFRITTAGDTRLVGDGFRLEQVLSNLTGNAVKFTERGAIDVDVLVTPLDAVTALLHVQVRDTGIGLERAQLDRLFHAFAQADPSTARHFGGTGLGLTISDRLVALMGGHIGVTSEPGVGSTFMFTARLGIARDEADADAMTAAAPMLPGVRVLVAEDNAFNQEVAVEILAAVGADVTVAADGFVVLELLEQGLEFDVILMDLQMPGLDGIETTRAIRARRDLAQPPIVAMTGRPIEEDTERCRAVGMDDLECKPISPEHLFRTIASLLPEARARRQAATSDWARTLADDVDRAALPALLRGDEAKARLFATRFVSSAHETRVRLIEAMACGDAGDVARLAHGLTAAAFTVGARGLAELCAEIETCARTGRTERASMIIDVMPDAIERVALALVV